MSDVGGLKAPRLMRLRYAGSCEVCGTAIAARAEAWYDPARKRVRCPGCPSVETPSAAEATPDEASAVSAPPAPPPTSGQAGASALREYERRSARHRSRVDAEVEADTAWRQEVRRRHPILGRVATAVRPPPDTTVPQHVEAWRAGSHGEAKLGARLDDWAGASPGRYVLHDRRIPGTRANIDHLAVAANGVWVMDAKEYAGRVQQVNAGGVLFPSWKLKVGGRDRSVLAEGVEWQQSRVGEALDRCASGGSRPPVFGVLCFVGAEWGLFSRPFVFAGVTVAWPSATVDLLSGGGEWTPEATAQVTRQLGETFAPA